MHGRIGMQGHVPLPSGPMKSSQRGVSLLHTERISGRAYTYGKWAMEYSVRVPPRFLPQSTTAYRYLPCRINQHWTNIIAFNQLLFHIHTFKHFFSCHVDPSNIIHKPFEMQLSCASTIIHPTHCRNENVHLCLAKAVILEKHR